MARAATRRSKAQPPTVAATKPFDPVTDYARRVIEGEIVAGKLVHLACERHLNDLRTAKRRGLVWDLNAATHAIDFFPYLQHSKGEWARTAFTLAPWQQFIVGSLFGWKWAATGLRRFREAYIQIARKNGKTCLAAGLLLYLLVVDGEPGAEVYTAATKRDQALLCWSEAARMVKKSADLQEFLRVTRTRIIYDDQEAFAEALGADDDTMDGTNPSAAVIDEYHAHKTSGVYDVLMTGLGSRRQPMLIVITTAGMNQSGPCYEKYELCRRMLELGGEFDDDGQFAYIAMLDEGDDWTDEANWPKSNPNLDISCKREYLRAQVRKAQRQPSSQNSILVKNFNLWTQQSERWIDIAKWDACGPQPKPVRPLPGDDAELLHQPCYLGLDLSSTGDLTSIGILFPRDGGYVARSRFFIPEETLRTHVENDNLPYDAWERDGWVIATPGNVIDLDYIEAYIGQLAAQYDIREIVYDPWRAPQLVDHLRQRGLALVEMPQTLTQFAGPTAEFERLVLKQLIRHDHNPVLRWNVDCTSVKTDPNGNIRPVKPDERKSAKRIDGVIALIMALKRAMTKEEPSVLYFSVEGGST